MNIKDVKELIQLVDEKKFAEFELERGDFKIRIRRDSPPIIQSSNPAMLGTMTAGAGSDSGGPDAHSAEATGAATEPEADLHVITSPIVGTFYRASSSTAQPFVEIGDPVAPQEPLCIIEAMKLMNEITSDVAGEVVRIYVENGQPVEFGQPLFGIRC